jgi:hypothetical protein
VTIVCTRSSRKPAAWCSFGILCQHFIVTDVMSCVNLLSTSNYQFMPMPTARLMPCVAFAMSMLIMYHAV